MKKKIIFAVFIWSLAILFYFYEFFLRIFLGTIATDIIASLQLTAEQFSIVAASYYIIYSFMQTPAGILADKYGARNILTFASLITSLGVFWLGFAQSFFMAVLSRFLIGFGSSFAFVSLLILALNWFDRKHFVFLCGLAQFLGGIGPILAGAPLAILNKKMDGNWRLISIWLGVFGIALTMIIFAFLKNKPKKKKHEVIFLTPKFPLRKKLSELLRNSQVWPILFFSGCVYISVPLLAAYWGTTYLEIKGFEKPNAAFIISMIWVGFSIGAILIGKFSEKIKRRKPALATAALIGMVITIIILYYPIKEQWILSLLFGLVGFSSSSQSLAFAVISEHVPKKLHAPALGLNNTAIMFFAAFIPLFVSSMIQKLSVDKFTLEAFTYGLSVMPIMFASAFLFVLFGIQETFCQQQQAIHKIKL